MKAIFMCDRPHSRLNLAAVGLALAVMTGVGLDPERLGAVSGGSHASVIQRVSATVSHHAARPGSMSLAAAGILALWLLWCAHAVCRLDRLALAVASVATIQPRQSRRRDPLRRHLRPGGLYGP
jgi:hypothetical protein